MIKSLFPFALLLALMAGCQNAPQKPGNEHEHHAPTSTQAKTSGKKSPRQSAMANVGEVHVHIDYASPSVRERIIWGGLVPYNEVWVTGAHMATTIHFYGDVMIAGKKVAAGKYAFFTIPGKESWTLILNKNWEQHLTDEYDEKEDVLRWTVVPQSAEHQESLTFQVVQGDKKGSVSFGWEKLAWSFEVLAL